MTRASDSVLPLLEAGILPLREERAGFPRISFLDFETSTASLERGHPIEVGVLTCRVDPETGFLHGPSDCWEERAAPPHPLAPKIVKMTGLSREMLKGKSINGARLAETLEASEWTVAHQAWFDRWFAEAVAGEKACCATTWLCTLKDAEWPQGPNTTLEEIARLCGYYFRPHRALSDATVTAAVTQAPLVVDSRETVQLKWMIENGNRDSFLAVVHVNSPGKEITVALESERMEQDENISTWSNIRQERWMRIVIEREEGRRLLADLEARLGPLGDREMRMELVPRPRSLRYRTKPPPEWMEIPEPEHLR